GPHLGAVRIGDFKYQFFQQPEGWPGSKVTTDMPTIVNIRQDPFERTPSISKQSLNDLGGGYMNDFYAREFWRFVFVQQRVGGRGWGAGGGGGAGEDGQRLPADAGPGLVQPGRDQEEDRGSDQEPPRSVVRASTRAGDPDGVARAQVKSHAHVANGSGTARAA